MRNTITAVLLLFMSFGYAQIKKIEVTKPTRIGKVGNFAVTEFFCEKANNTYRFTFRDINYTHLTEYKSFEFDDIDNAFENLYNLIIEGFNKPPKDDVFIELPEGVLKLHFIKAVGIVNMNMDFSKNGISGLSGWLTKRKVIKLFGKKKKKK
ncbi:hypothetical protein FORMB_19220 [Formosa sp. Hel1_33_131]|uniref:hypothetical protein n=1 Tax=Formosa sp. Hel1_33_131 TaxID=1336794 RepID=UPI00084E2D54|nr:hypothetical protein [Formosa sp. Hel1_33_131]AOR28952.1 hypothetical protein FORMB_19220 [Formosa sp. Hel1_33_131]